jgi:hypothetical protein
MIELSCSPSFFNLLSSKEDLVLINGVEELSHGASSFVNLGIEDVQPLFCFAELDFFV